MQASVAAGPRAPFPGGGTRQVCATAPLSSVWALSDGNSDTAAAPAAPSLFARRRRTSAAMPLSKRRSAVATTTTTPTFTTAPADRASAAPPPPAPLRPKHGALIVGGGPAGVAAALALAKLRGWTGVSVVERSHDLSWADPDRSYVYGVDGRGLRCAAMLGLDTELLAAGVDITSVPLTRVGPDGKANTRTVGTKDPSVATHWMPRASLMGVLAGGLEAFNAAQQKNKGGGGGADADADDSDNDNDRAVEVLTSSRVVAIERVPGGAGAGAGADGRPQQRVAVRVALEGGEERVLYPSLVLGCDGINSLVRRALQQWAAEDAAQASGSGGGAQAAQPRAQPPPPPPTFALRSYPSPAAGLRFKVLRLPPNPTLRDGTVLPNPTFAVLTGSYKGRPLRMGLLPVRDTSMGRTGNIITLPGHPFWSVGPTGDAAAFRRALAEAFPQADFDALVPEDVMRAFAESDGGVFPPPQASDGVAFVVGEEGEAAAGGPGGGSGGAAAGLASAVLLVGDAAHAFPPDLGQGVNAALQDVQALVDGAGAGGHLAAAGDAVAPAARAYGADRAPEADALARLVSFGYPYQYQQAPLRAKLWMVGFLARLALSKLPLVGGGVFAPPAFMMVQNTRLRYADILGRARATTARLVGLVAAVAAVLAWWLLVAAGKGARAAVAGA